MRFDNLVLQITDACPLQCAYCCVESGPARTTTMPLEDALSYVRQAHTINPQTLISVTGGEPFVRYPLLRAVAQEAHALGMASTVITSAVWCRSEAFAARRLAELQRLGLRIVTVTYDSFHQPWVPPERVRACVAAGAALGLTVYVSGSVTRDSRGACDLVGDLPARFPGVQVADSRVQPTGRGATIPLESLLVEDWGEANLACPVTNQILIRTDGSAYPCCSTGGDGDALLLGNARETPLAELRARAERSLWYRIIAEKGFLALEQIVRRYHPEVVFPRRHLGACHLCALVFGPGPLGAAVRDALARFEADRTRAALDLWSRVRASLATTRPAGG